MTRFARAGLPVPAGPLAGLVMWSGVAQAADGSAATAPPTGTARVHLLVPSDVPHDQRHVG